ncbi:MAG: dienelactone hydrolase family protein [Acidobacteriota bacterium]|nr:dienelactone hydrolase family protein [Acidobacteriota bacterium]
MKTLPGIALSLGAVVGTTLVGATLAAIDESFPVGQLLEGVATVPDPTQTYTLYLPSSYVPDRRFPALLIFDPRGRATMAAELFREAAEEHQWILLSSNDTRSDGPMEPNVRAVNALWPEVHERFSTDPERIYAAGFSGGAMLAYALASKTGELAGVIGAGGRLEAANRSQRVTFPHFAAVGDTDFNYSEMRLMDSLLQKWGAPHRLEVFDGPHGWMPQEIARRALGWMEIQAMRSDLRPDDTDLVTRLFEEELAHARGLAGSGSQLEALRSLESTVDAFLGLHDAEAVDRVRKKAHELSASPLVNQARKDEKKWDGFEKRYFRSLGWLDGALSGSGIGSEDALSVSEISVRLDVRGLRKSAKEDSYRGTVATRILETIFTRFSFYRMRALFAAGDFRQAATVLSIATEIKPERPDTWYNLACAHARSSNSKKALDALARAVDAGFSNIGLLESDSDLESLREKPGYLEIRDQLRSASGE